MLCLPGGCDISGFAAGPRTPSRKTLPAPERRGSGQPSALPGSSTFAPSSMSFSMKFS